MHTVTYLALCAVICLACGTKVVEVPAALVDRVRPFEAQCIKESGSIADSLYHFLKSSLPSDEASKKFIWCFGIKAGYIDETGHVIVDNFLVLTKHITEGKDELIKVLNECDQITGGDLVESTSRKAACFQEKSPFVFSIPMTTSR